MSDLAKSKYNARMRLLIQIKAIFLGPILLILVLTPVCLIAFPFSLERRLKLVSPVWEWLGKALMRFVLHTKIDIREDHRAPRFKGVPCKGLYVANHQSFIDIPLMVSVYQAPPIMKKEILNIPVFGWVAWISGALPVDRSSSVSRRKIFDKARKRILRDGIGLQVYPEGTRSKDSHPKAFEDIKKTLLVWAFNEKIPVIPTSLYGTRGVLSSQGMIKPGRHVGIIVHQEILPEHFQSADEFARICWEKVIQGHDQMKMQLGPLNES